MKPLRQKFILCPWRFSRDVRIKIFLCLRYILVKKVVLLSLCALLVSCGGESSGSVTCHQDYWNGILSTCIPSGWEILDQETLRQRGVPEETIVAFQSEESVSGQFPTVAVTREKLSSPVSAKRYSEANIRSVEVLDGYEHIDTKEITVAESDVSLHIFTAQPIEGEPRRRFYQVSFTNDDVGFTATGVSPVSIHAALEKKMLLIMQQIGFEERVQAEE